MRDTINFIIRGGEVTKFHTIRTIQTETTGHHSFLVALLAHLLTPLHLNRGNLLQAALTHDLGKQLTGTTSEELEQYHLRNVGLEFPLSPEEKRILKVADSLAEYVFCKRERELGNKELSILGAQYLGYLESLAPLSHRELEVINAITK